MSQRNEDRAKVRDFKAKGLISLLGKPSSGVQWPSVLAAGFVTALIPNIKKIVQMKPDYIPDYVENPDDVLTHLLALNWLNATEARLEYFMSDEPRSYIYGKPPHDREYHSSVYTDEVTKIQSMLNTEMQANFNVCFLNRYDTQKNQLGWHADDSPTMDRDHPIAVVSFGAEREIWWKLQTENGVVPPEQRQKLGHGSLFVMPARFQDTYFHRIPKADREVGIRVSLTFRRYVPLEKVT